MIANFKTQKFFSIISILLMALAILLVSQGVMLFIY